MIECFFTGHIKLVRHFVKPFPAGFDVVDLLINKNTVVRQLFLLGKL